MRLHFRHFRHFRRRTCPKPWSPRTFVGVGRTEEGYPCLRHALGSSLARPKPRTITPFRPLRGSLRPLGVHNATPSRRDLFARFWPSTLNQEIGSPHLPRNAGIVVPPVNSGFQSGANIFRNHPPCFWLGVSLSIGSD